MPGRGHRFPNCDKGAVRVERAAEAPRQFVLKGLQFAIMRDAGLVWLSDPFAIEGDEGIGDLGDRDLLASLQAPAPERLESRAVSRAFADLAATLDPDVFVIGGGVSEAGDMMRTP